jgi:RHS repeat-associated protein
MGRKTNTTIAPASGIGGTTSQSFQYNGLSQTTFARDTANGNNADVTLVYDSIQRTVEEAQTYGGNTRYVTNDGFTSLPVSQFTYPNTRQVNNSFDKLYRRQQIIEAATSAVVASWQFFGPNRIATVTLGNGLVCSNMNNAQTRSAIQSGLPTPGWGSIATDQLGYDGAGRMIGKRFFNGSNVIVGFTSAYDMSSNKYFERPLHAEERSSLYDSYDSMNHLLDYQRGVLASGGGSVTTPITLPNTDSQRNYNLDALGNWTSSVYTPESGSQITDQRNHNKLNEIIQRTVGTSPAVTFQYDGASGASNGNLANDGTLTYSYDSLNRPIAIGFVGAGPRPPQQLGAYVFDAFNRRIRKTITNGGLSSAVPNGTMDYLYLGNQVMEERNPLGGSGSTDTPVKQYIWGTYIDELIQVNALTPIGAQNLPAGAYYLLQDLLYRAVALTNSSGNIVEAYDTDAYAQTIIYTGPGPDGVWFTDDDAGSGFTYGANDMIFCGYRYDPETRLYFVRNRMFLTDSGGISVGRWIQRDPIAYSGGINLYEYVGGRPVVFEDPNGTSIIGCPKSQRRPKPGYKPTFNGCGDIHTRWIVPQYALLWTGYFTPACNNHDICYGTCNSNKQDCDLILESQLRVACLEWWDSLGWNKFNPWAWVLLDACYAEAKLY